MRTCIYFMNIRLLTSSLSFPIMTFLFSCASAVLMSVHVSSADQTMAGILGF